MRQVTLAIISMILCLAIFSFASFQGVAFHNETTGPVFIQMSCFLGEDPKHTFVLAPGEQNKLEITCPGDEM
jgi:hypothetical protein